MSCFTTRHAEKITRQLDGIPGREIDELITYLWVLIRNMKGHTMSTTHLSTLKFSAARKLRTVPDAVKRRNKLLQKLMEQRSLAAALANGEQYNPRRLRSFTDKDTGTRTVKEVPVRIKPWFWTGEKGETLLAVHYGSRTVELQKGKTAVEVGTADALVGVLDTVIAAVHNGELDAQIEAASTKLRDGFKR